MKLWGGRFDKPTEEIVERFTASLHFDSRLWPQDIEGSIAFAQMLAKAGVISEDEAAKIVAGLEAIGQELEKGSFEFQRQDEDIHSAVERALTEKIGPQLAGKLHSGRSRNDQVATDLRLYLKQALPQVLLAIKGLQSVLVKRAEAEQDTVMPGYTHLQRAQPVLLPHHLMAHFWALQRDAERIEDCLCRVDVLPLGSGALAGSNLELDRDFLADKLGFAAVTDNSLDAVSDRDFAAETLFCLALLGVHLSRIGEEIVLWTSQEFGFARLDDAYATGSSMMPQKKNPDVAELARGKTGRMLGNLTALLVVMKGLPLAYNRDLQEDKEPLFDSLDTAGLTLEVLTGLFVTIEFDALRMKEALAQGQILATDYAERLVKAGMPLRKAHELVGKAVKLAEGKGCEVHELDPEDWQGLQEEGGWELEAMGAGDSVGLKATPGSTAPFSVREQIAKAKKLLEIEA